MYILATSEEENKYKYVDVKNPQAENQKK